MNEPSRRIYLDNAATSFPKPQAVYDAVDHYQRELGGAVGRGATKVGKQLQQTVDRCRSRMARLIEVPDPANVIFTFNGTDSLNFVLHGLLNPGDHVVATCWEHNSVLRPLAQLGLDRSIQTTWVDQDGSGRIDLEQLSATLNGQTRLVCLTHASNVTGIIQPVKEVVELAHAAGALVILDAAQTVGHIPVSMTELGVDFLACPGHKGLLGPLGTGVLAIKSDLAKQLQPLRQGGTGTVSELEIQPDSLPEKFESGNHNAPGLFGLEAALAWLELETVEEIQKHEQQLTQAFLAGCRSLPAIEVYADNDAVNRVGVVSLNATMLEPQVFAALLDEHFGIETRAGLHCSPRAHTALGTTEQGGTVRFSFGPFNTLSDVDETLEAIGQITAAF